MKSDPPSSVSSGSIDLEALRAKLEAEARMQNACGLPKVRDLLREASAALASLGERRGTQEENEAIRARMAAAVKVYIEFFGAVHDAGCPCDDTCDCGGKVVNDGINAVVRYLEAPDSSSSCSPAPPQEQP